jgi:hypothetical protein
MTQPIGEEAEHRSRSEMEDWSDSRLLAAAIKDPAVARGIAAQQILSARRETVEAARYDTLLNEITRPPWKTSGFWLAATAAVTGCISVYPILFPPKGTEQPAVVQQPAASVPPDGSTPASFPPLKSNSSMQLQRKQQ